MACEQTAGELLDTAKCFVCLDDHQLLAVTTYLMAVKAGGSTDPGTLLDSAKCFLCLTDQQLLAIQARLLCSIDGG